MLLTLKGPRGAAAVGTDQARRVRGRTPRIFRQDRDVLSKNPGPTADPVRGAHRARAFGVPFLLVTFSLGKQRKVTRAAGAKAFVVASKLQSFKASKIQSFKSKVTGFPLSRE
ncbi:hypothetical protein ACFPN1_09325 [Lysobacter yangpyeongensis]|uniref:Uncharacterized protein n=1 Tax=Lysobacter yangpyeongensis TaxID=346182 RepID=A0ABW0SMB6_9GAMM